MLLVAFRICFPVSLFGVFFVLLLALFFFRVCTPPSRICIIYHHSPPCSTANQCTICGISPTRLLTRCAPHSQGHARPGPWVYSILVWTLPARELFQAFGHQVAGVWPPSPPNPDPPQTNFTNSLTEGPIVLNKPILWATPCLAKIAFVMERNDPATRNQPRALEEVFLSRLLD